MSIELTSLLHQLKIVSLVELCTYKANSIAESFDEEQLNRLNNALRDYLWQAEILPAKMKYLAECQLPLKVLGLAPYIYANLANDGIQNVTELIQRDTTDHLTTHWPIRDRLAVRARIFCLLTFSTEQLNQLKLSNPSNLSGNSKELIQALETGEEQQEVEHTSRIVAKGTSNNTADSDESNELEDCSFIHKPWLRDWLPGDFSPTYPAIVKTLFEDAYQLPIATSRHHEIWAGAQMKTAERL